MTITHALVSISLPRAFRTIHRLPVFLVLAFHWLPGPAASTVDATDKYAWSANTGWINMAGDGASGLVVGEYVCSGYAWSGNVGWIHFGDGTPIDGVRYQNNAAGDYGVNVTNYEFTIAGGHTADLRGYAYGANIGWIHFESTGNPRVDLGTGALRGLAWGANIGWINLGELGVQVSTTLAPGADSDSDGIADAYEQDHAGNLTRLGASNDEDNDDVPDTAEYEADTDPLDPNDHFRILRVEEGAAAGEVDVTFTTKPTRVYRMRGNTDLRTTNWANLGDSLTPYGPTMTATITGLGGGNLYFWRSEATLPLQP